MIAVVGSANMDLVVRAPHFPLPGQTLHGQNFQQIPGGKGANQAVAAARAGANVAFVGAIGPDANGTRLRETLADEGIDLTHLSVVSEPTGVALITVVSSGENSIIVAPGANSALTYAHVREALLALEPAYILCQLETTEEVLRAVAESNAIKILNPAPATPLPQNLLARFDWIIPNEVEAAGLSNCPADRLIITRGPSGVEWQGQHFAAPIVTVVDTTGAGDTFCGYFVARLAQGFSPGTAIREGIAAASQSVTHMGAIPSIPKLPKPIS